MDWREKLEQSLNQGYDTSRKLFGKAKKRAVELGEYGVLSLEVRQLDAKHTDLLTKLGSSVYTLLAEENRSTVTARSQGVKELLEEIKETREELERKRHLLKEQEEASEGAAGSEGHSGSEKNRQQTGERDQESGRE